MSHARSWILPISIVLVSWSTALAEGDRARLKRQGVVKHLAIRGRAHTKTPRFYQFLRSHQPALSKNEQKLNADPSFKGTHPMFQRLVKTNFYSRTGRIARMQRQADKLRRTRSIKASKRIDDVEFISFDLETTDNRFGEYDKTKQHFLYGPAEIFQFGYVIYRGGKVISEGRFDIRPDGPIADKTTDLTGYDIRRLQGAPGFEAVAPRILALLQGRVAIGHGAIRRDWSALQSNFARLGVTLPSPRGLVADNHLLSLNHHAPKGWDLEKFAEHFKVPKGTHHDALEDARTSGATFFAALKQHGVKTLGGAFKLMRDGYANRAKHEAPAKAKRQKLKNARQRREQKQRSSEHKQRRELGQALIDHFGLEYGKEFGTLMGGLNQAMRAGMLKADQSPSYYVRTLDQMVRTKTLPPQLEKIWPQPK